MIIIDRNASLKGSSPLKVSNNESFMTEEDLAERLKDYKMPLYCLSKDGYEFDVSNILYENIDKNAIRNYTSIYKNKENKELFSIVCGFTSSANNNLIFSEGLYEVNSSDEEPIILEQSYVVKSIDDGQSVFIETKQINKNNEFLIKNDYDLFYIFVTAPKFSYEEIEILAKEVKETTH